MREKWKKYVEKFKSLGDKVSGVKGITAVIPAVCLAVLMVTVLTGYKTPQAKKYEASETEDISQIKEALAKESTAAMAETTKKNTTKKEKLFLQENGKTINIWMVFCIKKWNRMTTKNLKLIFN